ncbi:unnamed protein product, partial [Cyprideis torosa]
ALEPVAPTAAVPAPDPDEVPTVVFLFLPGIIADQSPRCSCHRDAKPVPFGDPESLLEEDRLHTVNLNELLSIHVWGYRIKSPWPRRLQSGAEDNGMLLTGQDGIAWGERGETFLSPTRDKIPLGDSHRVVYGERAFSFLRRGETTALVYNQKMSYPVRLKPSRKIRLMRRTSTGRKSEKVNSREKQGRRSTGDETGGVQSRANLLIQTSVFMTAIDRPSTIALVHPLPQPHMRQEKTVKWEFTNLYGWSFSSWDDGDNETVRRITESVPPQTIRDKRRSEDAKEHLQQITPSLPPQDAGGQKADPI